MMKVFPTSNQNLAYAVLSAIRSVFIPQVWSHPCWVWKHGNCIYAGPDLSQWVLLEMRHCVGTVKLVLDPKPTVSCAV